MLQAILSGVNELRANAVTRQTLTQFYDLQTEEMRVCVEAETAPMHHGIDRIATDQRAMHDRIGRLESQLSNLNMHQFEKKKCS